MKLNENIQRCFNQLELMVDLKKEVSQRDDNECELILQTLNELKTEIEKCEHTLNIIHSEKIPEDDIRRIVLQIIRGENSTGIKINLISKPVDMTDNSLLKDIRNGELW